MALCIQAFECAQRGLSLCRQLQESALGANETPMAWVFWANRVGFWGGHLQDCFVLFLFKVFSLVYGHLQDFVFGGV